MKRRSVSLFVLAIALQAANLTAQSQPKADASTTGADRAIVQAWDDAARQSPARIQDGRLILSEEERDSYCACMRTYRMKREVRGSDATRPAGYTSCVPARRFDMLNAVVPDADGRMPR